MKYRNLRGRGMRRAFLLPITLFAVVAMAQSSGNDIWEDVDALPAVAKSQRQIVPAKFRPLRVDLGALQSTLQAAPVASVSQVRSSNALISLPYPDGSFKQFRLVEASIMAEELQARYPEIRTYAAEGVDDPGASARLDLTPAGFHGMIISVEHGTIFIDPYAKGVTDHCISYFKRHFQKELPAGFNKCSYEQVNDLQRVNKESFHQIQQKALRAGDCQLRTYRLALACTGEYATFHGGNTSSVMAAMVTTMNRVNGIYERDATLTMQLVANNDDLIYLNSGSDPYDNNNGGNMLGQNISTCNSVIGSSNYDIGHVFSTGGGGVAYLGVPCTSSKAGGVTGQAAPVGDPFDVDYVAHEMGHQYGANHTQNNSCNRNNSTAVEPGSASSIMGYAGICNPNVQSNSDALFHAISLSEIHNYIVNGSGDNCPTHTPLANGSPSATAPSNKTIPAGTPFVLEGSATDPNAGDQLTYTWEQMDNEVSTQPPSSSSNDGPNFRSILPSTSPDRYMPNLPDLVAGNSPTWEVLSDVTRHFDFRFVVRDNAPGGGCNDEDDMRVNVDGGSGPFVVTDPNSPQTWTALTTETVSWNVAGTGGSPVNASNVDIFLSIDGGFTYPITLATGVPNNGSANVTVPNNATTQARVMVRGSGNIFFDISNTNFTIDAPSVPDYVLAAPSPQEEVCAGTDATFDVNVTSVAGFTGPVTLSTSGLPGALGTSFSVNPVIPTGSSVLTISNTSGVSPGVYNFQVNSNASVGNQSVNLELTILPGNPSATSLVSPANGALDVNSGTPLVWNTTGGATEYNIRIATDAALNNIVESVNGILTTSYTPTVATQPNTTYYWRVRGVSNCGNGAWSPVWSFTTSSCIPVDIIMVTDRWGDETTWEIQDDQGTVMASGGPYAQEQQNGSYPQGTVNACLPAGCYDLVVNDSYGDGYNSGYGQGSILVSDEYGFALVFNDDFNDDQLVESFCVPAPCNASLPLSTDFESGFGYWAQDGGDDFDWTINSGGTQSNNTGPSGDHTSGTGQYIYIEASSPNYPSNEAILRSGCVELGSSGAASISFWYHMYGGNVGELHLDVYSNGAWVDDVWSLSGDQGDQWLEANVDLSTYGERVELRFRAYSGPSSQNGWGSDIALDDILISNSANILLDAKVFLEGPFDPNSDEMTDGLRAGGYLPTGEPFTGLGFTHVGDGGDESVDPGVFNTAGANAIVEWLLVELRSSADNTQVLHTRSALLQADGDVVELDGTSPLAFLADPGNYYVAFRHRNHLGFMTQNTITLSEVASALNTTDGSVATFGTEAQTSIDGSLCMWTGNALLDTQLKYTGSNNDRDAILDQIGGTSPTAVDFGYEQEDVTLDGVVKYTGSNNDRDPILVNIGGVVPTATRTEQLP